MADFKSLTLKLYNHKVKVTFIPGTLSYNKYGVSINGLLKGRIWGVKNKNIESDSSVIGITLEVESKLIDFYCEEIQNVEAL